MTRDTGWIKSSRSSGGSNACVEVRLTDIHVLVRDSKNPTGPQFRFRARTWRAFIQR
ncbi:DUF397 domain-containing protein [Actinosynnema sp. NPDC023587]|uniref:DUF397 domain-containing protein n=1 Tax=Actinosynnema sp. NPDC023587 TaxID=3154695 RepID=UPI0033DF62C1